MSKSVRERVVDKRFWSVLGLVIFFAGFFTYTRFAPGIASAADPERVSYVDTHVHLDGRYLFRGSFSSDYAGAVETALANMNNLGIQKSLIMPPPFPPDHPGRYDYSDLAKIAKNNPDRFAFLGGGGTLNPMIQESVRSGTLTPEIQRKFEKHATEILRDGALGFGEMTAEHLSFAPWHPYEAAPPDHPLFLLLADIAARHDVPIDLHMEAVPHDMPLPARFDSPPNPKVLRENLSAFERLLSHDRKARIVWAHVGWDNTGYLSVALLRRLLEAHPNLYMSLKIDWLSLPQNRPLSENGEIRPEWAELIRAFPDRFLIGSDQFYPSPKSMRRRPPSSAGPRAFLNQLPPDLAREVGYENAVRIYRLK